MRIWRHLWTTHYLSFIIVLSSVPRSLDAPDDERVVLVPVALVDVHPAAVGDEVRAAVVLQGRSKRWALGCVNSARGIREAGSRNLWPVVLTVPVLAGVVQEAGLGADLCADEPAGAGEEVEAAAVGLMIGWASIEARVVLVHAHRVCNTFSRHFLSKASHTL